MSRSPLAEPSQLPSPKDRKAKSQKPATLKPWDQRPLPKRGDGSKSTTYAAVGRALSIWTEYEINLAKLFATFITAEDHTTISPMMVFGSIRTFEGRSEMLQTAAIGFFAIYNNQLSTLYGDRWLAAQEGEFSELARDGDRFVARRNEIAHGVVRKIPISRSRSEVYAPQPAPIERKKNLYFMMPKFAYTSKELNYYTDQFDTLGTRAGVIHSRLRSFLRERRRANRL
jgi:hypothetical protein